MWLVGFKPVNAQVYPVATTCGTKAQDTAVVAPDVPGVAESVASVASPEADIRGRNGFDAGLPSQFAHHQGHHVFGLVSLGKHLQFRLVDVASQNNLPGALGGIDIVAVQTVHGHRVKKSSSFLDHRYHF